MVNSTIPVYEPYLQGNEKKYLLECIESGWISGAGAFITRFEEAISKTINVKYVLATSNGTVALHLALLASGISAGDEVLVPTLTYVATANSVTYTGAKPIFVDCDPNTWQISPKKIEASLTGKTRAIIAVHLYGSACEILWLKDFCLRKGLILIEDCAEALGTTFDNRAVGSFGDVSTFSFYGNKTITCGEGGAIATHSSEIYEKAKLLRGQGRDLTGGEFFHRIIGYNYRLSNLNAALGLAQIEQLDSILKKKKIIYQLYKKELSNLAVQFLADTDQIKSSYWMVSVLFNDVEVAQHVRAKLASQGIETRPLFMPMHLLPIYRDSTCDCLVAEDIFCRGVSLPSSPALTEYDILRICSLIRQCLKD